MCNWSVCGLGIQRMLIALKSFLQVKLLVRGFICVSILNEVLFFLVSVLLSFCFSLFC